MFAITAGVYSIVSSKLVGLLMRSIALSCAHGQWCVAGCGKRVCVLAVDKQGTGCVLPLRRPRTVCVCVCVCGSSRSYYSGTSSLIRTRLGQKKVSCLSRYPDLRGCIYYTTQTWELGQQQKVSCLSRCRPDIRGTVVDIPCPKTDCTVLLGTDMVCS